MIEPEAQAEISEAVPVGQAQPPREQPPRREPPRRNKPGSSRSIVIAIAGGLITAGAIAAVLWPKVNGAKPAAGNESVLEALAPADINAAIPTLDPATSKAAVDEAKNCKVPLAWVTLTQRPGEHGDLVRIRSGTYLSPPIKLTPAPQRIAIPYPAPYPAGRGVLTLVGEANQVGFYLTPGGVHDVNGAYSVNVHWQVRNPCP